MISRRNFLSITLMMATLFFLFQFSQIVKEQGNDYDRNEYAHGSEIGVGDYWGPEGQHFASGDFVVYVGSQQNEFYRVVSQWCQYTKRNLVALSSMSDLSTEEGIRPEVIFVSSERMFLWPELPLARRYAEREGIPFVLSNLPEPIVLRQNYNLMEFLGISKIVDQEVALSGVHLFEGFMLGGEAIYEVKDEDKEDQDLVFTIPWYQTGYNTKTFMMGMVGEEEIERIEGQNRQANEEDEAGAGAAGRPGGSSEGDREEERKMSNEELPAIVWRNSVGGSKVYIVHSSYLQGVLGMGILSGIMADLMSYEIYPVVNAQNVTVANLGGFSKENQVRLNSLYSRDQAGIIHNILLPDMRAMLEQCDARPTYFLSPQYDYDDEIMPIADNYVYYMQQIKEQKGEAGWSMEAKPGTSPAKKVREDSAFQASADNHYEFSAFYVPEESMEEISDVMDSGLFANLRTISSRRLEDGDEQVVFYYDDRVTLQSVTNYAHRHTYMDDLRLKAVETVLGYSNALVDLNMILWPQSANEQWEQMGERIASNLNTYWGAYGCFEPTTLSESDARLRTFFKMDYVQEREGNMITIKVMGTTENVWFVLRTHDEKIADVQGGSYKEIENNAYLICAQTPEVRLTLKKK